jgi:hypothetical protein
MTATTAEAIRQSLEDEKIPDYRVVVSVSYGDTAKPGYKHTRHMMTYTKEIPAEERARTIADRIVQDVLDSGLFGIYKEERS